MILQDFFKKEINFLKTFIVAFFIVYLFKRTFIKFLREISLFAEKVDNSNDTLDLKLERGEFGNNNYDELDIVVNSLNTMNCDLY